MPTVLLVEDDPAVRRVFARILAGEGYRVLEAPNGESAMQLVETAQAPIALLVTDVVLPGMSGQELARRIVERVPGLRTLFVSGYGAEDVDRRGSLPQGSALLDKPLTRACLLDAVRRILGGAQDHHVSSEP
jgi:two-component system, cell cycle sensor histidine kinase and response regulator CckA